MAEPHTDEIGGVRITGRQRVVLSKALYAIHRKSHFYTGLTAAGEAHLERGGSITPSGSGGTMSFAEGMNTYSCCSACQHSKGQGNWPCETVKLLLEARIVFGFDALELEADDSQLLHTSNRDNFVANTRPDGSTSLHRFKGTG